MKLLHFAHRPEAQAFLMDLNLTPSTIWPDFFFHDLHKGLALVISGEGIYESIMRVSAVCRQFPVNEIINLGVTGSLRQKLKPFSIHSIRTSYAHDGHEPLFHSYTTADPNAQVDCLSFAKRVLHNEQLTQLKPLASLVDRELWAIGKVAKFNNVPFRSYKIVSDTAGNDTQCASVRELAAEFSNKLYLHFKHLKQQEQSVVKPNEKEDFSIDPQLYLSFTQQHQYRKDLKKWATQRDISLEQAQSRLLELPSIQQANTGKEKTRQALYYLKQQINPLAEKIMHLLWQQTRPLHQVGCKVHFDQQLEKIEIQLRAKITSLQDKRELMQALEAWDWHKFNAIMNGEIH